MQKLFIQMTLAAILLAGASCKSKSDEPQVVTPPVEQPTQPASPSFVGKQYQVTYQDNGTDILTIVELRADGTLTLRSYMGNTLETITGRYTYTAETGALAFSDLVSSAYGEISAEDAYLDREPRYDAASDQLLLGGATYTLRSGDQPALPANPVPAQPAPPVAPEQPAQPEQPVAPVAPEQPAQPAGPAAEAPAFYGKLYELTWKTDDGSFRETFQFDADGTVTFTTYFEGIQDDRTVGRYTYDPATGLLTFSDLVTNGEESVTAEGIGLDGNSRYYPDLDQFYLTGSTYNRVP